MTDFVKGQTVRTAIEQNLPVQGTTWLRDHRIPARTEVTVTSTTKHLVRARVGDPRTGNVYHFPRHVIEAPNGEAFDEAAAKAAVAAKPKPRPIGQKPEGDHISLDDPRIQWIFEDAARVAKNSGHCYEYDDLCDKVGIPGRLRNISVHTNVNGLEISTTIQAKSQKHAEALVKEKLAAAKA